MKKASDILFLLAVLVTLAVPVLFFNFKPDQISVVENRSLAELAPLSSGLSNFMNSIDSCVNDRIGFRDQMMQFYNQVMYGTLKANHGNVITGEDGWLFYFEEMPDYAGTNIDPQKIQRQVDILKAIDNWCAERDITFILAVGPNKSTVYSNYMPEDIHQAEQTKLDFVVKQLEDSGILVSYPKDALIEHRDRQELYLRLDTHWNSYGARFMLDDMIRMLDLPQHEFSYTETQGTYGDLLNMLGLGWNGFYSLDANIAPAPNTQVIEVENTNRTDILSENADKIICYRDSFHGALIPYYGYYFHGSLYRQYAIDFDLVEQEAPKYLILSCVERYFDTAIDANAGILG